MRTNNIVFVVSKLCYFYYFVSAIFFRFTWFIYVKIELEKIVNLLCNHDNNNGHKKWSDEGDTFFESEA